tara:strand:- start:1088 stop:1840 length:753 start_codon:yes stop_codon:yes gene_type:complete
MIYLISAFLITAFLYASVGFGGGSTYNALLILYNVDYSLIPKIALTCNLIVVIGGTIRYQLNNLIPWKKVLPLIIFSAPFAWIGGRLPIDKELFLAILGISLLVSGMLLLIRKEEIENFSKSVNSKIGIFLYSIMSVLIGLISGLVGIGGGIFLSPILHLTKTIPSMNIAAISSVFIFINSIAGLSGQFMKDNNTNLINEFVGYYWLFFAVLIGGSIGTYLGIKTFHPKIVRRLTAILVIYVSLRILLGF